MNDKCFLILGGGGMVGFQVAHRIARRLHPQKMVIASLYQREVREAVKNLKKDFPDIEHIGVWGDIFVRGEFSTGDRQGFLSRQMLLENPQHRGELFDDLFGNVDEAYDKSQLVQLILIHKPDVIVDCINTATAISYQDIFTATHISKRNISTFQNALSQPTSLPDQYDTLRKSLETLMISQYIPQLIRHVIFLNRAMRESGTRIYLKVGTTGTGGMGLNIPYTHGEDKPSAKLMSKTAIAFAHTGLLFLMARTPAENYPSVPPIIKEIKPAAMVGWVDITGKSILKRGKPFFIYKSTEEKLGENLALTLDEEKLEKICKLRIPVVDTGENGVFTKGEFEAITALRQMEFMTPEEIARVVELEIRGVNTGKDVIAAVDSSIMGPSYRAGFLRSQAFEELERLEAETQIPSVAIGELGPPELSKLLWEAFLLKSNYGTLSQVLEKQSSEEPDQNIRQDLKRKPVEISITLENWLRNHSFLQQMITSVGIPILLPDGKTMLRGIFIRIPEVAGQTIVDISDGDINHWANKGWVDLRPENMARWLERFEIMRRHRMQVRGKGSAAVNRAAYLFEEIRIGEVVGWIFNNEMGGYRLM